MQSSLPKIIAIVHKEDYAQIRALIPSLPEDFLAWVRQRLLDRRVYEVATGRLAAVEQVDPAAYRTFCAKVGLAPSQETLDDWATREHWSG